MPGIFKNSLASKLYIEPLATQTMTGSAVTAKTLNLETFGQIRSIAFVISGITLTGNLTVIIQGGTTTAGGSLTTIATITITTAGLTGVLQIDAEDIVESAQQAGLLPAGYKSLVFKITGTNTNTVKACIVAETMHDRVGQTPSSVSALT